MNSLSPNTADTTNGSLAIVYYMVSSGLKEVSFYKFTEDPTDCTYNVKYTITVATYSSVPSFLTLDTSDSTFNKLKIQTTNHWLSVN